ncbi:hypothetical protein GM672_25465 [Massilia buxea]|uniref:DUF6484 domain-containing protein n=2 Tax=Pseudoduganella buxea TaxID=1949069 RepID=A0A6I3T3U2_9BURK|nr:hypothetical protein [Pseudoduganella buxea]
MRPNTLPAASDSAPVFGTDDAGTHLLSEVVARTPQHPARANGVATGVLDAIDGDGTALVSIPAWGLCRVRARSIAPLDPSQAGHSLALGFDEGDPLRPIVLGVMLTPAPAAAPLAADVLLDGERVVLEAAHEIELRCGEAALILSADGRIELRGTYITSQASATQRILGGSVNVN